MTEDSTVTPLDETFFARDALLVAEDILGMHLTRGAVTLRITEVEAYRWPDDSASHARFGRTERNRPMWGPPGRAYVYFCYGLHQMLNVVTNPEGEAAAVLIRACEPVRGLATIRRRRGGREGPELLTGPGKVGAALGLDTRWSGHPLFEPGGLELVPGRPPHGLLAGPRVGISFARDDHAAAPWRLAVDDSDWVTARSGLSPRAKVRRRRRP